MSKLSQLKQDAYQAGKKKDWDQAVSIYEKILDLEKNNPTVINEMGDLCLKAGESGRGVSHFLKAASKYRKTGLLNNAVAIYKKILRHDSDNLNAHWYLAETRASQGLIQEGEQHGLQFLTSSEEVSGELKEIFLGRCKEMFELYPASQPIQEMLLKVFRTWDMGLEASRCLCLLACLQFDAGNEDDAKQGMAEVIDRTPEVVNYPEYTKWNNKANPVAETASTFEDFGEVSLSGPETGAPREVPASPEAPAAPAAPFDIPESPAAPPAASREPAPVDDETSFGDLKIEVDKINSEDASDTVEVIADAAPEAAPEAEPASDEDGYMTLDMDSSTNFDDLIAQAADQVSQEKSAPESDAPATPEVSVDVDDASMDSLLGDSDAAQKGDVDLLAEILAEDSGDPGQSEADQLNTITQEIGAQVGGDEADADASRQYEMGLVYLEMGLFDQACGSLEKAAKDEEFAVRAYETWGMALCRDNKPEKAVEVLSEGLNHAESGSHSFLGLLYHIGKAYEQAGDNDQAVAYYEQIQDQDRSFLDVGKRLSNLTSV